ncbi:hypothetical protein SAMN02927924_01421 [Sphingobium faniae]|nr:hypothetical protein SAMN02927924_01421 [Sphingobium faniae]
MREIERSRGRPPVARARVLNYWRKHGPCSIGKMMRLTGLERSQIKRILLQESGGFDRVLRMELTDSERSKFQDKVDKAPGHGPDGNCWIWTGSFGESGYPRCSVGGRAFQASHIALAIEGNPRPEGLLALHSCDHKPCVNPAHLRWGTDSENQRDHFERGQRGAHWLPERVVHEIHQSGERNIDIARRLGLSPSAICNIRKGRYHRHIFEQYCLVP